MKTITDAKFEASWTLFTENLEKAGIKEEILSIPNIKEKMRRAAAATNEESGVAYPGALVSHINFLCAYAVSLSEITYTKKLLNLSQASLLKVCCLQHLSKIDWLVINDNDFQLSKGINFKFVDDGINLRTGERSVLVALLQNILLLPEEYEAIVSIDKDRDDKFWQYCSPLSLLIKQANEMTSLCERKRQIKQ